MLILSVKDDDDDEYPKHKGWNNIPTIINSSYK